VPTTRKIVGSAIYGDTSGASGSISFTPQTILAFNGEVILPAPITARVVAGAFEVELAVTDEAGYQPSGWVWQASEQWVGGRTFFFELAEGDLSPILYTSLVPATSLANPYAAHTHPELLVTGPKGDTGELTVGTVTPVNPDVSPAVTNSGTSTDAVLDFDLPRAATFTVGTVTPLDPDQSPDVTLTTTDGDVTVDFDLPRAAAITLGTVTPVAPDVAPDVALTTTNGDVSVDFDLPRAPTFSVGVVTTGAPSSSASVTDVGTDGDIVLDFDIPAGEKGDTGDTGSTGTIAVGTVTPVGPDQSPDVTNSGTSTAAVFDFDLPRAPTFGVGTVTTVSPASPADVTDVGTGGDIVLDFDIPEGEKGDQGDAATIAVGTVTPVAPDVAPDVTNSGTSGAAVFDFDLPRAPVFTVGTVTPVNPDQNPAVTDVGTDGDIDLDFDLPRAPTFAVGTVTTGVPGSSATVTDVGTDGDIVLDFEIPEGETGGEAFFGQISRQSDGTVTVAATSTFYAIDLAGTVDTANANGVVAGVLEDLALKNDTGETLLFTVIGSCDVTSANNELIGIRLAVDGVPIAATECRAQTGTNNYAKLLSQWMVELAPGEEVSIHIANFSTTQDITVKRAKVVAFTSGRQGDPGVGVPVGGTEDQVLAKSSATDYDTAWVTLDASDVSALPDDAKLDDLADVDTSGVQTGDVLAYDGDDWVPDSTRVASTDVASIEVVTETEYDALDPADPTVLYVVIEDPEP
jgi:hypothetical protein